MLWVTIAMAGFAGIGALSRYVALEGLDPLQAVFFRNVFVVVWLLPLFFWRGLSLVRTSQLSLYGVRVALSFVSMVATFEAYALIPIGEVTAIGFLSPLFGTLFAILWLGERVRLRRWLALGAGLVGALVILRPGIATLGVGQLAALGSAMTIGMIGPLVKQLSAEDDADRIVFITNLLLVPLSLVPALFVWQWPRADLWAALAGLGLVATIAHLALVRGYLVMEASLAMTFKFSRLLFAVALGFLVFGETIDLMTWIGAAIIFVAAAYVTHRESRIRKAKKTGEGEPSPGDRWIA